ncbi:E3 ubiquitin-protein ligase TRIM9-like isoform X1 [Centruroides vittatus]|uniref:E3 ubiquitin-protein ligase TRIM9-like isoform X1 n=1 Tax=Centruroides vittatus TaxID=120091 RepID=UPI00350F1B96
MEEELKCPVCKHFYNNPVLLPCYHTLCLNCALHLQQPAQQIQQCEETLNHLNEINADGPDVDKLSLLSETDSGVVCNSRPNSYVGTPNIQGLLFPPLQSNALSLTCPVCHKIVYFDENGAHNLPKNRALQNIVDKYGESKNLAVHCQLCEGEAKDATVMCEQCEVFYCESCRESCHPTRGPLAKHSLLTPQEGKATLRAKNKSKEPKCGEHADEGLSMYCMLCKTPVCVLCLQDGRHINHDVQALGAMCKAQKTELSQNLQTLSEKAKGATEFIQRLKSMAEKVTENCTDLESSIDCYCELLIEAVQVRKQQLIEFARKERDHKMKTLRDQVTNYTGKLQQTTGLLQFCIEALKETDPTVFLQVGSSLINRVSNMDVAWPKEIGSTPWTSHEFDLTLDHHTVLQAIEQMTFAQMKPGAENEGDVKTAPGAPVIIPEECTSENNCITIAWQPHSSSFVEGFVLELNDGQNGSGNFREVYCGRETICTVDGLHFNSIYDARVKAFNSTGEGPYSEVISLQTAEVAWFTLDPSSCRPDIVLSNDNQTVTCDSYEHRVILGNIGFSRGVHYWEITVDRYDNNADPAFGIARFDVSKDQMLGKDDKGWSMYIDHQRSWFLHADHHENRTDGGIEASSVVGILLDLENHQLSFYVNDERQGPVAFTNLHGVVFPAISLNRNVQVTIQTGLDPPTESEPETEGEEKDQT